MRPLTTAPIASPVTNVRLSLALVVGALRVVGPSAPRTGSSTHTLSGFGVTLPTCSLLPVWQSLPSPCQHAFESSGMS